MEPVWQVGANNRWLWDLCWQFIEVLVVWANTWAHRHIYLRSLTSLPHTSNFHLKYFSVVCVQHLKYFYSWQYLFYPVSVNNCLTLTFWAWTRGGTGLEQWFLSLSPGLQAVGCSLLINTDLEPWVFSHCRLGFKANLSLLKTQEFVQRASRERICS